MLPNQPSPQHTRHLSSHLIQSLLIFILLGGVILYLFFKISNLQKNVENLSEDLSFTKDALSQNTKLLSKNVSELSQRTTGLSNTINNTQQNIDAVKTQVGGVEQSLGSVSGTVGTLQKLSQIDPQLLKKYSKVYFMNENYTPSHLTQIPSDFVYSSTRQEQFMSEAYPALQNLLNSAKANGVNLFVKSAYRSFAEQKSLKSAYSVTYGAGTANAFSADQGYSEHQLGTTLDFIASGLGGQLTGFDKTTSYQWLLDNAYRFGFELSYPKGNGYYVYEPWHWRYIGIKLATYLHDTKQNFYNMDQREIDKYLINIFD